MGVRPRLLLGTSLVLLGALLAAQSAFAATASVRVEGTAYRVAPATWVAVPAQGTLDDTDGTTFSFAKANALAALDLAADLNGFSYDFNTTYGAPFLTTVAGLSADPVTFADGWTYFVNGVGWPVLDMGAGDFALRSGDKVIFAQNPDATFARGTKLLKVRYQPGVALTTGQTLTLTVVGDDAAKANSAAEATRYGIDPVADPTAVERSAQFAPVAGAVVHVGARVYTDGAGADAADGVVTVSGLPEGTYRVWAERSMDAGFGYVRSSGDRINVATPLTLTGLTARPDPFSPGQTVRFTFALSRAATVKYTVRSRSGTLIASLTRRLSGGSTIMRWNGENAAGRTVRRGQYRVRITATDAWGRTAAPVSTTIVAR